MKYVRNMDSFLSKILHKKSNKIKVCLFLCSILFILNIMVMTDQYSLNFFLTCSFLLLLVFMLIDIVCIILKTINKKNNGVLERNWKRIYGLIKSKMQRDYQKDLARFHNKYERIFYYCGMYCWIFLYGLFFRWEITYHIVYWCSYLLFCVFYRLTLHVIYEKYD